MSFDVAILFPNSLRVALESWLSGIPRGVGYRGHWRSWFMNQIVRKPRKPGPPEHHSLRFLRIARECGAETSTPSSQGFGGAGMDGRAYNLDESIQRMRYRDGYEKKVWMEKDKVYKVTLQPLNTSNYFAPGHRLRIEVSSSNFPRFDRNLNTGGRNFDETKGVIARNAVHHSKQYPSAVKITVVRKAASISRGGN